MFAKNIRRISLALLLCVVFLAAACTPTVQETKIEFTDSAQRVVSLAKLPERIIALSPSDVEILYALGAQDKIIAVGEYCTYPAEVSQKEVIGTGVNTSVEQLIALNPDLVIMNIMAQEKDQVASLESAGITVAAFSAQTISDTYGVIESLGMIAGKTKEASTMVADMKAQFDKITKLTQGKEQVSGYIEVSPLAYGLYTCGSGTFLHELLEMAGVKNIFGDLTGWAEVSEEQVIALNPDFIFTTISADYGVGEPVEELLSRENWKTIPAIANGNIVALDPKASTQPGPRLTLALQQIYDAVQLAK